jgi:hypothetical protein
MTPAEQARLDAICANVSGRARRREYPAPVDIAAALTDYIKMSRNHVADCEPMARQWRRDGLDLHGIRSNSGMTTSDFGTALSSGAGELLQSRFHDLSADLLSITGAFALDNFKAKNFTALSFGTPPEIVEDAEPSRLPAGITQSATTGVLRSYGGKISFSYAVWSNHGGDLLASLQDCAGLFSLIEQSRLVEIIEAATIATSTSTGMTTAGLDKANQAIRSQSNTAGQIANLGIYAIITPPVLEFSAHTALQSAGLTGQVKVICLPLSVATAFYCVCDPSISAPLLRLSLRGSRGPKIILNGRRGVMEGVEFFATHDFNYFYSAATPGLIKCVA